MENYYSQKAPLVVMKEFLKWIIYEDKSILVINKPGWLVCHPSKDGPMSSLVGVVREYTNLDKIHLVSRLDRETSGLVVFAKDRLTARKYQMQIQSKNLHKEYIAILSGKLKGKKEVNLSIAHQYNGLVKNKNEVSNDRTAKEAYTLFEPIISNDLYSLVKVVPKTGRKHQIRVHAQSIGHSIVGDKIYGPDETLYLDFIMYGWTNRLEENLPLKRQALHCYRYEYYFSDGKIDFTAPLKKDLKEFCLKNSLELNSRGLE